MYSMFSPPSCDHQTTNIFRSPPVPSSASFNIQVLLSNGIKRSATRELVFSNQKSTKSNSTPQLPFKIKKEDGGKRVRRMRPTTPTTKVNLDVMDVEDGREEEEENYCWPMESFVPQSTKQEYFRNWFNNSWIKRGREGERLISWLLLANIKMIAVDFDLTMTMMHSGGSILPGSSFAHNVLRSLSKDIDSFLSTAALHGLKIVCVTFADDITSSDDEIGGERLVRSTMLHSHATFPLERVYAFYPDNYLSCDKYSSIGLNSPMTDDKSYHLSCVCNDFSLTPNEILLIDDREKNCVAALREGYFAIKVNGNEGFSLFNLQMPKKL